MIQHLGETIAIHWEKHPNLVVILYGPTASGKSSLSLQLGGYFAQHGKQIEIISADSRQVYRYMDIGTDKIRESDRHGIPHHGIDLINPDEHYTAYQWQQNTKQWIKTIQSHGHLPLIVGGTGLYIDTIYKNFSLPPEISANQQRREELYALEQSTPGYLRSYLNSFDSKTAHQIHPNADRFLIRAIEIYEQTGIPKSIIAQNQPLERPLMMISLERETQEGKRLIQKRVGEMIQGGLITEVQSLLQQGYTPNLQSMNGIGYRQTIQRLSEQTQGILTQDQNQDSSGINPNLKAKDFYGSQDQVNNLIQDITLATTRYAKRQRTRFRRYQKDAQTHPKENVYYLKITIKNKNGEIISY